MASAGARSTVVVTEDGKLFMWGDADVLGAGVLLRAGRDEDEHCPWPVPVARSLLGGRRVVAAACGASHTACIDSKGSMYVCVGLYMCVCVCVCVCVCIMYTCI